MIKPPISGPYYPVSTHVRIYRKGPYYTVSGNFIKGPYYPTLIYLGTDVELCHSPPEGGSISSHVAHWNFSFVGGCKQKTSLLNSGILDSTCVPSREEEEDRGEGHSTCEAYRPYVNMLYKYYVSGFDMHGCGSYLRNEQLVVNDLRQPAIFQSGFHRVFFGCFPISSCRLIIGCPSLIHA